MAVSVSEDFDDEAGPAQLDEIEAAAATSTSCAAAGPPDDRRDHLMGPSADRPADSHIFLFESVKVSAHIGFDHVGHGLRTPLRRESWIVEYYIWADKDDSCERPPYSRVSLSLAVSKSPNLYNLSDGLQAYLRDVTLK